VKKYLRFRHFRALETLDKTTDAYPGERGKKQRF
jgi:hypothetical protein